MDVARYYDKIPGVNFLQKVALTKGWPYVITWAHRISGVLLVLYICFHIMTLSALRNPEVFENKMKFFAAVIPSFLEWFLAFPVIFHALNGGRLILYELYGNRKDQLMLKYVMTGSVSYLLLLGFFMILSDQHVSALFFWVYVIALSGFVTWFTVTKTKGSGASLLWKMQRISGAFLLLMIPAHMLFMHLDPSVGRDAQVILARMDSNVIKLIDLFLLFGVLYHGAYGVHGICRDYLSSRKLQLITMGAIVSVMAAFAWIGITLTILV